MQLPWVLFACCWVLCGHAQEDTANAASAANAENDPLVQAERMAQSDASGALEIAREIFQQSVTDGNASRQAAALRVQAIAYYFQADFPQALEQALEAEKRYSELGNRKEQASLLSLMGAIHGSSKQYQRALEVYRRALEVSRAAGDGNGEAIVLMNIGKTHYDLANYAESIQRYEQSIKRFVQVEADGVDIRPDAVLFARMGIADAQLRLGNTDEAIVRANAVLQETDRNGIVYQNTLAVLGEAYLVSGKLEQAERFLTQANEEAERTRRPAKRAETLSLLARLAEQRGDFAKALELQRAENTLNLDIYNEKSSSELARLQSQFEDNLKEQQLKVQALELERSRTLALAATALAIAALLVALILLQLYRVKQKSNRALRKLAETDSLTGLLNRRTMYAHLKSTSTLGESALCLLDIDNFKTVNDRYGHAVGDKLLVAIGQTLLRHVRGNDRVARWGGEEFLVLLANRSLNDAKDVAQRLCEHIAAVSIELENGHSVSVTASLGVAHFERKADDAEIIRRADAAMYEAKLAGKNRIAAH